MSAIAAEHGKAPVDTQRFADDFSAWAHTHQDELAPLLAHRVDFDASVADARRLRKLLWDAAWGRFGWPERFGGLGDASVYRALVYQELFRLGWGGPNVFEHIEIIAPTLARFADPRFIDPVLPRFLDGSEAWAQGFSEPEAGSDLAALRTRAVVDGASLVVNGSKIWTSWAKWSRWCLALVRTGTPEERHRGLTMVAIDLTQPGVEVQPIRQANGTDELAQVFLDSVHVPLTQVVGEIGEGWRVAMYLLARERGTLAWMRHCGFRERLLAQAKTLDPSDDRAVGHFVIQWAGVRAAAAELVRRDSSGEELGPEAAFNKLLMTRAEQDLYDLVADADVGRIAAPVRDEDQLLQRDYIFSRVVTVYGGSQQMQLITVARHILGLGRG